MATPLCYTIIIPFFTALLLVGWIHPRLVKIALLKNIVDNPDARKLQRTPVPVLGGVAVFFGVVIAIGCMSSVVDCSGLPVVIMAMMAMLYTGTMDDILSLSPGLRFVIEIVVVLLLIFVGGYCIDDFHGLWNIGRFSYWYAVPLTVVAAVGIINAINLVDGVNGLSSGYCIMACLIFGTLFFLAGEAPMTILAAVSVGALIPFFLHNVFGKTSKMFIGDGGTLVMGVVMSVFVIAILQNGSRVAAYVNPNVGLVPFTLAVLSVPVFDTLRVMSTRILKGTSPFRPDKTHLHHMFIDLGCSHVATTLAILGVNMFVVLCWWALEASGFSIAVQLYAVIAVSLLVTSGLYHFMQWHICRDTRFMRAMRRLGYKTHISRTGIFFWLQQVMDRV
ncbi:MraY family glycosyltransferase [Alistipes finegoldii]|jgi:UDP-GlcNAc:undecaprenyl-phosphate GlcNAc-1-phosphate transferase|uniref:glycosyltransferase family 4 protein n=1 Tax=Alistipes finegoldii TaxID=214856 RepID=UPI0022E26890|nr:MraY family glycosyltransferase [Alistipes finegoldii]